MWKSKTLLATGLLLWTTCPAWSVEVKDPLTDPKHPGWLVDKFTTTVGSVSFDSNGALLKVEPRSHALLKRSNEIAGSDANPLDISVYIISEGGFNLHPSLHLYWDNNNYASVQYTPDNHVYVVWCMGGVDGSRPIYNVAPESKKNGYYVRMVLTSRNLLTFFSMDGENWQRLCDLGGRPGKLGVAPSKILLGRGWTHEKTNKDAHLDLCNDYYPDANNNKGLIASTFRNFSLRDTPMPLPDGDVKIEAAESWEQTEEKMEPGGVPRSWTLLGPRPDIDFHTWNKKDALEPETNDNWNQVFKDENGRNLRVTRWQRPDDDKNCYVDLAEILEPNNAVLAYAKTEIDWPVEGPANLFFDDNGRAAVFLNNKLVFTDAGREARGAIKDRFCVPVHMSRGKNIVKLKTGQMRGDWGFYLRVDRTDPAYRVRTLEKLLEFHAQDAAGWRGAHAMFEMARRYQQLDNFPAALDVWQKAIEKFSANEEERVEAFAGKVRLLAMLRDWDTLSAAGAEYLAKYGRANGARLALDATVTGETLSGKADAAEERVKKWVEDSGAWGEQVDWGMRLLAGAQGEAGQSDKQFATLERLGAHPALSPLERACAYFDAAFGRYRLELDRLNRGEKLDAPRMTAACKAAQKGIDALPGGSNPQVQAWVKQAADDLRTEKYDRALAGYWGAAVMALCASDPQSAPFLAMTKAYTLPSINIDPKTNKPRDLSPELKQESWKIFTENVATVKMIGNWKAIGPFDYDEKNPPPPEKDANLANKHPGRGGEKAWLEVDPAKTWNDTGGSNLKVVLGDCRGGVAYIAADFEAAQAQKTFYVFSSRSASTAWLDGQLIDTRGEDWINVDGRRIPIDFPAGKHRLLIRLWPPGDDNFVFRGGFGIEPEMACNILRFAWLQREFPDPRQYFMLWGDVVWWTNFGQNKVPPPVFKTFCEAFGIVYYGQEYRWHCTYTAYDYLKRSGMHSEAAAGFRWLLRRIETSPSYGEQLNQIWTVTWAACEALANSGETTAVDELLRDFIAMYPDYYAGTGFALVYRGILREDFAQTLSSRPFFERAIREYPQASDNFRFAAPGLAFAKKYMPDRPVYATSDEAQAAVDVGVRLMRTGDPADIEKAMSKFGELIRSGSDSLIRISDSPYYPRLVGIREFVRAFIAALNDDARDVYLKTVASSSDAALRSAADHKDIPALEAVAAEYHFTAAAVNALNLAGNLYLDRGDSLQAVSAFRALAQQNQSSSGVSGPMLAAKTARALFLSGQIASARAALAPFNGGGEFAAQSFTLGGQTVTGAQFAQTLSQQIDRATVAQQKNPDAATETHLGNIQRRGPPAGSPALKPGEIAWVRPLAPSAAMDVARWRFVPDPFVHLQPFPALSGGRAYVSTLESIQAIELDSGRAAWQQAWDSTGTLIPGRFTGFPINCPTVFEGKLYGRVLLGRRSALQCLAADTGKDLWTTVELPELRGVVWISDPLIAYGLCIACYLEPSDMNQHGVAAIDAVSGRLRWKHALATGATGIEVQGEAFGSSMQLGPPAADERIVYAQTGLGSLAALNAFTGEVVWISGYPRVHSGRWDSGNSGEGRSCIRPRILKLLSRGPVSPIVTPDTIVIAPKDAPGLIGFDRKSGAVRWQNELLDSPYLAGVCGNNVLTIGNTVRAIQIANGATAWEYALNGEAVFGQPGYSGEIVYLPTEDRLHLIDARSGKLQGTYPWDPRVGPLGNLAISGKEIVGVNTHYVAAIGAAGGPHIDLPMLQAENALLENKPDLAAAEFGKAAQSGDNEALLTATSQCAWLLPKFNKKEEGLADVERAVNGKPPLLESFWQQWEVARDVFAEALRAQLGTPPPPPALPPPGISGTLGFAWRLDGENPLCVFPAPNNDGPQDRFVAYTGTHVSMVRLSSRFQTLWQAYAGPGMTSLQMGPNAVCVWNSQHIAVFDRETGEPLWQLGVPLDRKHRVRTRILNYDPAQMSLNNIAIGADALAVTASDALFVFDVRTGRELWANDRYGRTVPCMIFNEGNLVAIQNSGNDTPAAYTVYDTRTGNMLRSVPFKSGAREKWCIYDRYFLSPDRKLLYVAPYSYNRMIAFDLSTGLPAWDSDSLYLQADNAWNQLGVEFFDGVLFYHGFHENHFHSFFYEAATGKQLGRSDDVLKLPIGGDHLVFGDKFIVRQGTDDKGAAKEVWKSVFTGAYAENNDIRKAFVSNGRLYLYFIHGPIYVAPDQIMLRTIDWNTGQLLGDQLLPGAPLRNTDNRLIRAPIEQRGNLLLYTTREGIFAYTPVAETHADSVAKLKAALADKSVASEAHRDIRRALNEIEPPVFQVLPAVPGARLDSETGDPAVIESAENYVPAAADSVWQGPQDLSAKVYAAWSGVGLSLAVDVRDDKFVPPQPGQPLTSGDSIRVAINGMSDPTVISRAENVVITMALIDGRTVINTDHDASDEEQAAASGHVTIAPDGKGARYELSIPWALIRRDPRFRPGDRKELRLGIAVFDNDGDGVKGAMEFGAGVAGTALVPLWMTRVTLSDISKEKIERYHKVIARLPDAPQSLKFMQQILQAKRGAKPDQERAAELEEFIKAHPDCANTIPALRLLRIAYATLGAPNTWDKAVEFAKSAKCPPRVTDSILTKNFRVWVLPDEKNPPKHIMLQLNLRGYGWCRRAYWGENRPESAWAADGTTQHLHIGPIPKPGQWTLLEMNAVDFEMDEFEIQGIGFTSFGGLCHFEQATASSLEKKDVVLLADGMPKDVKLDGSAMNPVAAPHHTLPRSWTAGPTAGLWNTSFNYPDAGPWFSFKTPEPPKPEPAKPPPPPVQKKDPKDTKPAPPPPPPPAPPPPDHSKEIQLYREMAGVVSDTPESLEFLGHVNELKNSTVPETPKRLDNNIQEFEDFLSAHPDTVNAVAILQALHQSYTQKGDHNAYLRCDTLVRANKLPRDTCRVFYSQFAPTWMDWSVLGPFQATGDRRGLDQFMQPEKSVDLTWRTKGAGENDIGWMKYSAAKDDKGKPNPSGFVDLLPPYLVKLDPETKGKLEKSPYFGYAYARFNVPSKRKALLLFGVNDLASIWVNNRRVVSEAAPGNAKDRDSVEITLNNGANEILVKPGVPQGHLGFFVRIADENGRPFDDLTIQN